MWSKDEGQPVLFVKIIFEGKKNNKKNMSYRDSLLVEGALVRVMKKRGKEFLSSHLTRII